MTCSHKRCLSLMNKVLDGEAAEEERLELSDHLASCAACRQHFTELKHATELLNHPAHPQLPIHFTKNVLEHLPAERKHAFKMWMNRHPLLTTAAICALPMSFVMIAAGRQGKNREDHYILLDVPAEHS